ncbi:MAG TPA: DUF1592 domain-containing protein [Polyangia bacterium]|nr:DUF1592 domain-containing protein [Polyangia bacterium]
MARSIVLMALGFLALGAGCSGTISGGRASAPGGGSGGTPSSSTGTGGSSASTSTGTGGTAVVAPPPTGITAASACTSQDPGPRLIRRLTAQQFADSLRDIFFQDQSLPALAVFSDPQVLGFSLDADALLVQGLTAQQLADYAEQVATWAVAHHLNELAPCQTTDASCRGQIINKLGKRIFREPLPADREAPYDALFAAEANVSDGVQVVLTAMLQSPYFLYRRELGMGSSPIVQLTPYEIASSLSYLLTGSTPDDQLLQAADQNQLSNAQQIDQQVQRLLSDRRAPDTLAAFFTGWLGLDRVQSIVKDDTVFKLDQSLRDSMSGETRAFVLDAFNSDASVGSLFTAKQTFLDSNLAAYYGVTNGAPSQGAGFVKTSVGGPRDTGLLAQASILTGWADAATSSPVLRGKLVRTRLLCQTMPPPPANVDTKLKPPAQAETTRDHFSQHDSDAACSVCHRLMDPIGFGFEHYDGFGRWRDTDNGYPVDATGTLNAVTEGTKTFNGLAELSTYLSQSADVSACYSRYLAYFAYGKSSWDQDACTYDAISKGAGAGGLRDVLMSIVHAPHFTQRSTGVTGGSQ